MNSVFSHFLPPDIGIDLGTAYTLIYAGGKGIVIREPTVVAQHKRSKKIVAIGTEAKRMLGRAPATIEVIRPLKDGVISDFDITQVMLKHFITETIERHKLLFKVFKPRVVIGIPSGVTEVERRAVKEAALAAGARKVYLIEEPMAAAIGVGLAVEEPTGSMIVDIGGGTTEIAVISLSGIVVGRSVRIAGDELTEDISSYIRQSYGLAIGERSAEEIKMAIGNVMGAKVGKQHNTISTETDGAVNQTTVRGRDLSTGLPKQITVTSQDVRDATRNSIEQIINAVSDTLEDTPPELLADIAEHGIMLAGGGALLGGLDKFLANRTKMPVIISEDPLTAVVRGCATVLSDEKLLLKVQVTGAIGNANG